MNPPPRVIDVYNAMHAARPRCVYSYANTKYTPPVRCKKKAIRPGRGCREHDGLIGRDEEYRAGVTIGESLKSVGAWVTRRKRLRNIVLAAVAAAAVISVAVAAL